MLRAAAWGAALGVLALTACYWLSRTLWLADLVNLVRPAVLGLALALLGLALVARAPLLIGAAALLALANAWLLAEPQITLPTAPASGARRPPVTIATFDVVSDKSLAAFTAWVKDRKTRPDVVGLQNLTTPWRTRIAQIADVYPFSASAMHAQPGVNEDILSRFPILDAAVFRPAGGRTAVEATVLIEGQPVRVFVIDPDKATGQARWAERNQYLGLATQWLASQSAGRQAVMLGDWNLPPWSPFYADVFDGTGLRRADAGWLPPATHALARLGAPLLRLSDDHVAVTRRISVEGCGPGPDLGSDHLPLLCGVHVR